MRCTSVDLLDLGEPLDGFGADFGEVEEPAGVGMVDGVVAEPFTHVLEAQRALVDGLRRAGGGS
jgi:hypothetical protein